MQPSETGLTTALSRPRVSRPSRKGNSSGSNSLPPRAVTQSEACGWPPWISRKRARSWPQPPRRWSIVSSFSAGVGGQPRIERLDRIAGFPEELQLRVLGRGQEIAVLGIEQEDQPHQAGEKTLVEIMRVGLGEALDAFGIGGVNAAHQLVQGAKHLAGELVGHLVLGLAGFPRGEAAAALPCFR